MHLAPIILFTYNRLEHTKKTIESLSKNALAKESELYIYSDAAKTETDLEKVKAVREYIYTIYGFKKINIIEAKKNKGLANSVIDGVTEIINKYKKVIVLEDDLVTSKYFLEYMNESLNLYEKREDIWSIAGYSPNIDIPKEYKYDIYLTYRGCSWGWATWKDRWDGIDWNIRDYSEFKKNKKLITEFDISGSDMSPMLDDQMNGRINSWAIRWCYNQYKQKKLTVYPVKSLVRNIGNDLSGTHTSITNKYDCELLDKKVNVENVHKIDNYICEKFKEFYDLNFIYKVAIIIKKLGLYKQFRYIRNKLLIRIK